MAPVIPRMNPFLFWPASGGPTLLEQIFWEATTGEATAQFLSLANYLRWWRAVNVAMSRFFVCSTSCRLMSAMREVRPRVWRRGVQARQGSSINCQKKWESGFFQNDLPNPIFDARRQPMAACANFNSCLPGEGSHIAGGYRHSRGLFSLMSIHEFSPGATGKEDVDDFKQVRQLPPAVRPL
ncbi:MAG: hypothetical protein CM15mP103_13280 [Gammaproteobacteria bacterium]|nr:MAG: hypothetical protein CM15mP103_13280 [Gammaproteobacteria bacterium]